MPFYHYKGKPKSKLAWDEDSTTMWYPLHFITRVCKYDITVISDNLLAPDIKLLCTESVTQSGRDVTTYNTQKITLATTFTLRIIGAPCSTTFGPCKPMFGFRVTMHTRESFTITKSQKTNRNLSIATRRVYCLK